MIYEFHCDACGADIEAFRKVATRDEPQTCECGHTMRRLISLSRFKMKAARIDPGKAIRHFQKLKRGERIYENPYSNDVVRLPDNKKEAEDLAFKSVQKVKPELKRVDFELTNF